MSLFGTARTAAAGFAPTSIAFPNNSGLRYQSVPGVGNANSPFTYECWVKPTVSSATSRVVMFGAADTDSPVVRIPAINAGVTLLSVNISNSLSVGNTGNFVCGRFGSVSGFHQGEIVKFTDTTAGSTLVYTGRAFIQFNGANYNMGLSEILSVSGTKGAGATCTSGTYSSSGQSLLFDCGWSQGGRGWQIPTLSANTWYHIAVTRNSSSLMTVWINGVRSSMGTQTFTVSSPYAYNAEIGMNTRNDVTQLVYNTNTVYIASPRITATAVYDVTQANITVPTAPLDVVAGGNVNNRLLLKMATAGTYTVDSSGNNRNLLATVGTPVFTP